MPKFFFLKKQITAVIVTVFILSAFAACGTNKTENKESGAESTSNTLEFETGTPIENVFNFSNPPQMELYTTEK